MICKFGQMLLMLFRSSRPTETNDKSVNLSNFRKLNNSIDEKFSLGNDRFSEIRFTDEDIGFRNCRSCIGYLIKILFALST